MTPTPLRVNQNCEDWPTTAHVIDHPAPCPNHDWPMETIRLRRIGWIDQKGNVWVSEKNWREAGGPNGSITPLLINPGCD